MAITPVRQLLGSSQIPLRQVSVSQSPVLRHIFPTGHRGQVPPPQSTSDSLPFWMPSVQEGAAQTPSTQLEVVQSESVSQARPSSQAPQGPPQSTSVSSPFFSPSSQVGRT